MTARVIGCLAIIENGRRVCLDSRSQSDAARTIRAWMEQANAAKAKAVRLRGEADGVRTQIEVEFKACPLCGGVRHDGGSHV